MRTDGLTEPRALPCEECWTLVGLRRGRWWVVRPVRRTTGTSVSVGFDAAAALAREKRRGDVVGFLHTHPAGPLRPSRRDVRTMRAWCSALGKPLLCLIARGDAVAAYRFDDDASAGVPLRAARRVGGRIVVG